jgi:putative membrane protein
MKNKIIQFIISVISIIACAEILDNVTVTRYETAIVVALLWSLLNTFIKPILVFLTFPITLLTLGLFLVVINIIIIMLISYLVGDGFYVASWWGALQFSILYSLIESLLNYIFDTKKQRN